MITPAATSSVMYTDGAAAAVPTFAGAGMAVDEQVRSFAPSLSPDASREHVTATASAGDKAAMGTCIPSSEHIATATSTHGESERMIDVSANSTSTDATIIHPPTLVVSSSDSVIN